jgi:tRNA(fMet)-specific endonuclease VapC
VTHLDTSALVDALAGTRRSEPVLTRLVASGEPLGITTLVLYEWLRGPRTATEREDLEALLSTSLAVPFGVEEAELAAALSRQVARARTREFDLAVAACALTRGARLWTLNDRDFADIPGLQLFDWRSGA